MDSTKVKRLTKRKPVKKNVKIHCQKSLNSRSQLSNKSGVYKQRMSNLKKNNHDLAVALETVRCDLHNKNENLNEMTENISQIMLARIKFIELQTGLKSFVEKFTEALELLNINEKKEKLSTPFLLSRSSFKSKMQNTIEAVHETSERDSTFSEQEYRIQGQASAPSHSSLKCTQVKSTEVDQDSDPSDSTITQKGPASNKPTLVINNISCHVSSQVPSLTDVATHEESENVGTPKLSLPDKIPVISDITDHAGFSHNTAIDMLVDKVIPGIQNQETHSADKGANSKIPRAHYSFTKTKLIQPTTLNHKKTFSSKDPAAKSSLRRKTFVVKKPQINSLFKTGQFCGRNGPFKKSGLPISYSSPSKRCVTNKPEVFELDQTVGNENTLSESHAELQHNNKSRKTFVISKEKCDVLVERGAEYDMILNNNEMKPTMEKSDANADVFSYERNINSLHKNSDSENVSNINLVSANDDYADSNGLQQFPLKLSCDSNCNINTSSKVSDAKSSLHSNIVRNCQLLVDDIELTNEVDICDRNVLSNTSNSIKIVSNRNPNLNSLNDSEAHAIGMDNNVVDSTEKIKNISSAINVIYPDDNVISMNENRLHSCCKTSEVDKEIKDLKLSLRNTVLESRKNVSITDACNIQSVPEQKNDLEIKEIAEQCISINVKGSLKDVISHSIDSESVKVCLMNKHKSRYRDIKKSSDVLKNSDCDNLSVDLNQCTSNQCISSTFENGIPNPCHVTFNSSDTDNEQIPSIDLDDILNISPQKTYPVRKVISKDKFRKFAFGANKKKSVLNENPSTLNDKISCSGVKTVVKNVSDLEDNLQSNTKYSSSANKRCKKSVKFCLSEKTSSGSVENVIVKDDFLKEKTKTSPSKLHNTVCDACEKLDENDVTVCSHTDHNIMENILLTRKRNVSTNCLALKKSKTSSNIKEKNFEESLDTHAGDYRVKRCVKKVKKSVKKLADKNEKENHSEMSFISLIDPSNNKQVEKRSRKTKNRIKDNIKKKLDKNLPVNTFIVEAEIHAPPSVLKGDEPVNHHIIDTSHRLSVVLYDIFEGSDKVLKHIAKCPPENHCENLHDTKHFHSFPKDSTELISGPEELEVSQNVKRRRTQKVISYKEQPLNRKLRR